MSQANPTDVQTNTYAENYVLYGDQSRAWRVTFPDSKCKPENVHTKASIMYKLAKVQQRIEELRSKLKKQTEEEFSITVSDLKKMLVMAAQGGLKSKIDAQGNKIPIAIPGAVAAIAEINRMDGNHHQYSDIGLNNNNTHNIMPVPTAASIDDWEATAKAQQEAMLNAG